MSWVVAAPEYVAAAASDLANIASTLNAANAAALVPTSSVLAAGADEVSATIAALFGAHAEAYQALSAQAALFHQQFVQLMSGGAAEYAAAEAANASPLQTVQQALTSAAPVGSAATQIPAAAAGPSGSPVPAASLAPPAGLAAAFPPSPPVSAAFVPLTPSAGVLQAAGPIASVASAPIGPSAAAVQAVAPTGAPAAQLVAAPAEAVEAGTAEFSPVTALPLAGTPLAGAPASRAYTPATPAYSPASPGVGAPADDQPAH